MSKYKPSLRPVALALAAIGCTGPREPAAPSSCAAPGVRVTWRSDASLHVEVEHGHRIASLYIATDDHLWVLHAFAALGTAEYRRVAPAHWQLVHGFEFACRHGDRACIDAFARRDGWSANVAEDGADRAFDVTTRLAPASARFAVVSLDPTTVAMTVDVRACPGISGGVLAPALQAGEPPATLDVDPRDWPSVGD